MIAVVYHVYLVGDWVKQVSEQMDRIINSKLYDNATQIWVTVNKSNVPKTEIEKFFEKYKKVSLEIYEHNSYEYPGIKKVREIGINNDAKILYFHTKGISNNWKTYQSKELSDEKIENVYYWRQCMEYFLIDKWEECVKLLDEFDNVGVSCNGGWFWGNFWWSKSEQIKKTSEVGIWGRWDYEAWLNKSTPNAKNYEFYHMGFNPFLTKLSEEFYNGDIEKYQGKKIILKRATYGTPSFQIDEGYENTPLNIVNDVTQHVQKILDKNNGLNLSLMVNNETLGGDPIWGQRKVLIIEFYPENHEDKLFKIGCTEGHEIDFKF